jgi:4-hydroxy-2-oxoheptanedioate aldolase
LRTNTLKQKLLVGQAVSVVAPFASSAGFVEMLGYLGFDGVFIDCEHGPAGWEDVEHMIRAADVVGYTSILRVDRNDAPTITRALDRGAGGIQIPHVNTAEEARAAVHYAKFAPLGERGWSGWRSAFGVPSTEFAAHANAETLLAIMLEETAALENLDELLQVEHVDVFFVAPGDLAQSMGYTGQMEHPAVQSAMDDALRRIKAAGRIAGTLTTPALLDHHLDIGVQFLYVNLAALLNPAAAEFLSHIRPRA